MLSTEKVSRRRFFTAILFAVLISTAINSSAAYLYFFSTPAEAALPTKWDTQGPDSTASYLFFNDTSGATFYAKNISTGVNEFSGTNETTVLQNAINALTNGGTIVVKQGVYNITGEGLTISPPLQGVSIRCESSAAECRLLKSRNGTLLKIGDGVTRKGYFDIRDMFFDGDGRGYTGYLLHADTVNSVKIENSYFEDNDGTAIYFDSVWGGGTGIFNSYIVDCGHAATSEPAVNYVGDTNLVVMSATSVSHYYYTGILVGASSTSNKFINIEGEGLAAGSDYTLLDIDGNGNTVTGSSFTRINTGYALVDIVGIRNVFDSNIVTTVSRTGVAVNVTDQNVVSNNYIYESEIGVRVATGVVDGNVIRDCDTGIRATGSSMISNNRIIYPRGHGIVMSYGGLSVVEDNYVERAGYGTTGPSVYSAIVLNVTSNSIIQGNNLIDLEGVKSMRYGIIEVGGANDNLIVDNLINTADIQGVLVLGGNTICRGNMGYTTEDGGSASVANGGTIAHGLVGTPTYAVVTGTNSSNTYTVTVGAANLTIGVVDFNGVAYPKAETVYWYAVYEP